MTASKVSLKGGTIEERSTALKKGEVSEAGHIIDAFTISDLKVQIIKRCPCDFSTL